MDGIINILKNSIEALQEGGKIIIGTENNPISVYVLDNGTSISQEVYPKLFSPFFSTIMNGQGIGLTIIREVLFNRNFKFSLATNDGWTRFSIFFS